MPTFQMPDRRAVLLLLCGVSVGFIHVIAITVAPESVAPLITEIGFFLAFAAIGAMLSYLSIRDGFSLMRPSTTRDGTPFLFWLDAGFTYPAFVLAGIWMAIQTYAEAL